MSPSSDFDPREDLPAGDRLPTAPAPTAGVSAEAVEVAGVGGDISGVGEISGVWELAWPTMTAFALQTVVGLVDMLFVAQLGTEAVAGVGIGSQVHFVTFALFAAVSTGTVALVARAIGAGKGAEADRLLQTSLALTLVLGVLLTACAPLVPGLIALFRAAPPVAETASSYLAILLLYSVPLGLALTLSSALRAAGDVTSPLVIGLLANVLNVIGDYALIFGNLGMPRLGTDGSAIATGVAFGVAGVIYLAAWYTNRLRVQRGPLLRRLPWTDALRITRIGVPSALEHLAFNVGIFLFLRIVTDFGTEAVSAYMVGVRILAFSFIPGLGFATAASTLVGQYLGAGRPDLAAASGWRATGGAVVVMTTLGVVTVSFSESLSGLFGAAGALTTHLTALFIMILGAAQPLMAIEFAVGGALRGAGDTRFPLLSLMTGLFVFRLGGATLLLTFFDPTVVQVWCCLLADYLVKAVLLATRFRRGRWQHLQI